MNNRESDTIWDNNNSLAAFVTPPLAASQPPGPATMDKRGGSSTSMVCVCVWARTAAPLLGRPFLFPLRLFSSFLFFFFLYCLLLLFKPPQKLTYDVRLFPWALAGQESDRSEPPRKRMRVAPPDPPPASSGDADAVAAASAPSGDASSRGGGDVGGAAPAGVACRKRARSPDAAAEAAAAKRPRAHEEEDGEDDDSDGDHAEAEDDLVRGRMILCSLSFLSPAFNN